MKNVNKSTSTNAKSITCLTKIVEELQGRT